MRSFSYEFITPKMDSILSILNENENVLKKSKEGNPIEGISDAVEVIIRNKPNLDGLCKQVQNMFNDLKYDFQSGRINQARYTLVLRQIKNKLLEAHVIKNENLDTGEIIKEIQKYIPVA